MIARFVDGMDEGVTLLMYDNFKSFFISLFFVPALLFMPDVIVSAPF